MVSMTRYVLTGLFTGWCFIWTLFVAVIAMRLVDSSLLYLVVTVGFGAVGLITPMLMLMSYWEHELDEAQQH